MQKKYILILSTISSLSTLLGYEIKLHEGFCPAQELITQKKCYDSLSFDNPYPVFYILIHGTFSQAEKFTKDLIYDDKSIYEKIPGMLFSDMHYNNQFPLRIAFNWSGKLSDKDRQEGGIRLANGLNSLYEQCENQGIIPKFILVSHSHGGNVVSLASRRVRYPIDIAIMLGTPIMRFHKSALNDTFNDNYLPKNIKQLFLFYSMKDFIQSGGAALNKFSRRFGPLDGIDLYNIHVLIDGSDPLHIDLHNQFIDSKLLALVELIHNTFKKNKNLVVNISDNPESENLVAIKNYDTSESSIGNKTDQFWPNWTEFTYQENETDEAALSKKAQDVFKLVYKRDFLFTAPQIDRAARAAQEAICRNIIGKTGAAFTITPKQIKSAAGKMCCSFKTFKEGHPRASSALSCTAEAHTPNELTAEENSIICNYFIGSAGRSLYALPDSVKKETAKKCCGITTFKDRHPQAAKALGCSLS